MTNVPIRTRLTVLRDGSTVTASIAFCASDGRSVPVSRCATCGFAKRFARDEDGGLAALECGRIPSSQSADESGPRLRSDGMFSAAAESKGAPVGVAVTHAFVCFAKDAPISAVVRYFETEPAAFGFPVVDDRARFIGMLPRATVTLAIARAKRTGRVAGDLVVPARVVSERANLAETFSSMCARGAQEMAVLAEDGTLVGVLRDIDALRMTG